MLFSLISLNSPVSADSMEFVFINEVDENGEVTLELKPPNIAIGKYRVRPLVNEGIVYIQDTSGKWISGESVWTDLPTLNQKIRLKLLGSDVYSVRLVLQLQEINTGKILHAEYVDVYRKDKKDLYIAGLNTFLLENSGSIIFAQNMTQVSESAPLAISAYSDNFLRTVFVTGSALAILAIYGAFKSSETV